MEMIIICFIILMLILVSILVFRIIHKRLIKKNCTCPVSLVGKVIIVTGANTGIGYQTALNLAGRGGRVILACRNESKAVAARDKIVEITSNTNVVYKHLDLSSLKSVRKFADDIIVTEKRLDILINNAGLYGLCDRYSKDGLVEGLQVNYFGPFLLTLLLLDLMKKSKPSRIINVSSIIYYFGYFRVNHINDIGRNNLWAYTNSKLCNVMFCVEFAKRFQDAGVVANSIHPGLIDTEITENINFFLKWAFKFCCWVCPRTVEEGAHTTVHVAISKECENISGKFFMNCRSRYLLPIALNPAKGSHLWDVSEKLVGIELNSENENTKFY